MPPYDTLNTTESLSSIPKVEKESNCIPKEVKKNWQGLIDSIKGTNKKQPNQIKSKSQRLIESAKDFIKNNNGLKGAVCCCINGRLGKSKLDNKIVTEILNAISGVQ